MFFQCFPKWGSIFDWQICSIDLTIIGTICSYLVIYYLTTIPLLMLCGAYFFLFIFHVFNPPKSNAPWWKYIIVSIAGLLGDYTAIQAYNKTSLASAMLLITTVIFWVAPLSYFILKRKISFIQIISIFLGAFGVFLVFLAEENHSNKWEGNLLALSSALCYAISTVLQELLVSEESVSLFLWRFSSISFPLSLILSILFEWNIIKTFNWKIGSISLISLYSLLLSLYYVMIPTFLQHSNAVIMNISCLTSNFFSLAVSILFFNFGTSWLYLIGFCFIPLAIILYVLNPPEIIENNIENLKSQNTSQELD